MYYDIERPAISDYHPVAAVDPLIAMQKKMIWLYFLLLIFEGALRKWLLPGLATPLLVIREPVAIMIILLSIRNGLFPANFYLNCMLLVGIFGFFTAIFAGHGSMAVALYGCRVMLLHFPLIFIIGATLNRQDVVQFGRITLLIAIPMALLLVIQFYSPQSAWVNRGVGGDMAGAGFAGALGYFRPPGTFSFTSGTTLFFSFSACFIFYFWFNPKLISKIILWLATAALLIAIPVSISRGLFFQVVIIMGFALMASITSKANIGKIFTAIIAVVLIGLIFSQTPTFQTFIEAFVARFETASSNEGGLQGTLGDRYLGNMLAALTSAEELPLWGYGAGMGSNVGSMLLTGSLQYLVAEDEWGRMAGEFGPLLGLSIIILRLLLSWSFAVKAYQLMKKNDLMPWILLAFTLLIFPQGSTAQPTSLGFMVMIAGLLAASLKGETPDYNNASNPNHDYNHHP
ncbi:hypothetical protein [Dyadobacter sp. CY326]|uniref:hypothetical protein n=1 Tax=Dyadobacter sp. CY326 TaxID=2907300 RepID=UPI001F3349CE|nr:hypothetical protein [Dyadobacter sp. CY326]MCE7066136.1 hypothetical protein [Dyadobacter sp. CY326]